MLLNTNKRTYIIAEAGINHKGSLKIAKKFISEAKKCGADAIKFQTYKADTLTTRSAERYWDPGLDTDGGGTQFDTFSRIDGLPLETYEEMKRAAKTHRIELSSTPFSPTDVAILEKLDLDIYKIASADIVDHELLERVGEVGRSVILSTGCARISEIDEAINILENHT